jgi:hypothetical protein
MENPQLLEAGTTLKPTGYGNRCYSNIGVALSAPFIALSGP